MKTLGWFEEQIEKRKQNDNDVFEESFINMADVVMGRKDAGKFADEKTFSQNAMNEILNYFHLKAHEIPDSITDINEQIEYVMRPYGIMYRQVSLEKGWYKDADGAMIGFLKESGRMVTLLPGRFSGYSYYDVESGRRKKIGRKNEQLFSEQAIVFYRPFPLKKMGIATLIKYILEVLSPADYLRMVLATLAVAVVGMVLPKLNQLALSYVLPAGSMQLFLAIFLFMICVSVGSVLLDAVKSLVIARIDTKLSLPVEAATMMRVMSLPADFFRNYSSGELYSRVNQINSLSSMLVSTVFSTGLTSVFSLVYILQIFSFAPSLVGKAFLIIVVTFLFTILSLMAQTAITKKRMNADGNEQGMTYAMIKGMQKIKITGAEKRMFARWAKIYTEKARLLYDPPTFLKVNSVLNTAISLIGTILLYDAAIRANISAADYYAFNTAYGMVSGAFLSLAGIGMTVAQIRPALERIEPIFKTVPEVSEGKRNVEHISGEIELNHVSFRYSENSPYLLDNLSLKIKSGQYVAIVGKTGCGKSTLMRLLLGFEKPQKGAIYYDRMNLENIDLKSLRRKIGVVMQNGKLFQGDIYSNIVLSAPWLTQNEAWEAAELSGIAEDIRKMPMGMNTMISEGSGGISGGQKQRLMIARAIAPKPRILLLDEATSALDNPTQKKISEALDSMKCTKIVIAHRLSTIRQCDRILVLDEGKIIEDGNYEELMVKKGFFAELVKRQQSDA